MHDCQTQPLLSPGILVDQYQFGHKTIILISLREEKNKDDIGDFHMMWKMKDSVLNETESWEIAILHKTNKVKMNLIFPQPLAPARSINSPPFNSSEISRIGIHLYLRNEN